MNEALTRILGPKAHMGRHKKAKEELAPESGVLEQVLGRKEYKEMSKSISKDWITLVKYKFDTRL